MKISKQFLIDINFFQCDKGKLAWDKLGGLVSDNGKINGNATVNQFLTMYRYVGNADSSVKTFYDSLEDTSFEDDISAEDKKIFLKNYKYVIDSYDEGVPEQYEEKFKDTTDEEKEDLYKEHQQISILRWLIDKTIPASKEAVEYWNEHCEDNDWTFQVGYDGDIENISDMTKDEMKEKVKTLINSKIGTYEETTSMSPVKYDSKGGVLQDTELEDAEDDDTFHLTNYLGNTYAFDGKEKALEKAKEMWIEKAKFQIAEIYIHRKISEPDGYFYWREQSIDDYL